MPMQITTLVLTLVYLCALAGLGDCCKATGDNYYDEGTEMWRSCAVICFDSNESHSDIHLCKELCEDYYYRCILLKEPPLSAEQIPIPATSKSNGDVITDQPAVVTDTNVVDPPPVPPQARAVLDADAGCTSLWPWSCITLQNAFILAAMVTLILIGIIALVMVCVSGSEKCRHRVIHHLGGQLKQVMSAKKAPSDLLSENEACIPQDDRSAGSGSA